MRISGFLRDIVGRKAFALAHADLPTPPIPPGVYCELRQKCLSILSTLYVRATTPLDSPEKSSHGHVDIIVSYPPNPERPPPIESLASALSSIKTLKQGSLKSFIVPYPDKQGTFAQVNVEFCNPKLFDWRLFRLSYGDLWDILNTGIQSFGLTVNRHGLHVQIKEYGAVSLRPELLFLTSNPDAVLRFVGLDVVEYRAGWTRVEDMFAFLARNRFMTKSAYKPQNLNHFDQKLRAERGIYRQFVEDWMPSWDNGGGGGRTVGPQTEEKEDKESAEIRITRRTTVLQEALDQFGKRVEYDAMIVKRRKQRLGQGNTNITRIIHVREQATPKIKYIFAP